MCHVSCQDKLVPAGALEELLEISASKGTGLLFANNFLATLGLQLGEFLGEIGVWCEDWGPGGCLVNDVNEGADAARYFSRRVEMALRVESTFSVLKWPDAYLDHVRLSGNKFRRMGTCSFCASMMTNTLSLTEAVDGPTPINSLNAFAMVLVENKKLRRYWNS